MTCIGKLEFPGMSEDVGRSLEKADLAKYAGLAYELLSAASMSLFTLEDTDSNPDFCS